ncbi:hypothetical protein ED733_002296 [Metarhizium rileyi]|uniref:Uncharacterized protein n=1 Tax=Metarhizium rileyi (strain RCEF 4871) TaxID=1649241 RepID=A0A5C6G303_METRR|nr:hypothetical protein ED733_002296 [Metarhizium rileyi]
MAPHDTAPEPQSSNPGCVIISGFVASGKTWLTANANQLRLSDYNVLDLDSALFPKDTDGKRGSDFAPSYLAKVKDSIAPNTIILISTHQEIRSALVQDSLSYALVYPDDNLQEEWMRRLHARDSPESLVNIVRDNWSKMLSGCQAQDGCDHFLLQEGQYLSDIVEDIIGHMDSVDGIS